MSSNIVFYKFIYSPITSFTFDGLSNEEQLQKHIQSLKQKELETENEDYSIRFLKLPINWCILEHCLEKIGNNQYKIVVKHHSMDGKIIKYNKIGEWELLS